MNIIYFIYTDHDNPDDNPDDDHDEDHDDYDNAHDVDYDDNHDADNDNYYDARSRYLENAPLVLWPSYRVPRLVSFCLWALLHLVAWLGQVLCRHGAVTWHLEQVLTSLFTSLNTTCSSHALTLTALSVIGQVIKRLVTLL